MQAAEVLDTSFDDGNRPNLTLIRGGGCQGERDFRQQLTRLIPAVYARAVQLCRSRQQAEDLVQDTLQRALRFESTFIPQTNMKAWLFQVLYSLFITDCRRRQRDRQAQGALGTDPCAWVRAEPFAEPTAFPPGLRRAVDSLPKHYAEVLLRVDVQELSYRDVAELLGIPQGTVMSRLHRARRLLRSRLSDTAVGSAA